MSLGQLLKKFVEWVRRFLWSAQTTAPKPFVSVREKQYPLGLLKLVEGRDTQHAVRTWIICPTQANPQVVPMDLHIYLDFVDITSKAQAHTRSTMSLRTTHTVTLMRASHALQQDGNYAYEYIFSKQYDFKGQHATAADVQARIACDRIAVLAGMRPVQDVQWADEVEEIYRQVMGREGIPSTQAFKFWRKKQQSSRLSSRAAHALHRARSKAKTTTPRYSLNNARVRKTTR
ncbi:MAG: hypothetical protein F6K09_38165 [Merismopedia sp. SIO2A8]|nr:hypothetical protein [Merismopedia sp. SIO2A8]